MDARQQRGMAIAAGGGARIEGGAWRVRSQSSGRRYRVNPHADACTCLDHDATGMRCKHVWAVIFTMTAETNADGSVTQTGRMTYAQDWSSYNAAQTCEKDTFMSLLADLCATIPQPEQANGRPRLALSDMVYAMTFKVFSRFSSRRFTSDLREAQARGYITKTPHFNSVTGYMSKPEMTPLLQDLIVTAALPLRDLESDFAIDSSGFATSRFERWLDEKHGIARHQRRHDFVKAHVVVGTRTNVVTAAEITDWKGSDTIAFPALVRDTAKDFDVTALSADKAYSTKANAEVIEEIGAEGFVPFKSNTKPVLGVGSAWNRMYHRFAADPETFMARYHRRSNVETTFAMVKSKFGDSVMSKSTTGQVNEVLCKLLAHNVVVVGQAAIEYGADPAFA